jgi:hypothetical protein
MKKIIHFVTISFFLCSFAVAQRNDNPQLGDPISAYLNLNNISTKFKNTGISDFNISGNGSGFVFPKGTGKTAIYESGLIWGAILNNPNEQDPHVGGSTYREGLQGGKIISPGIAEDPNLPHVRIYRVRPDVYPGGPWVDLSVEAIDEGKTEVEIRTQYEQDWFEWRAIDGAPFNDVDANGIYNPNVDVPGVPGAAQTIWFVANDLSSSHTNFLYGTEPMGVEYQATYWEYRNGSFLDNLFFRKYKLINKGTFTFNDMYISMWSDPDVGKSNDDYVGCDTTLNMVYAYNAYEFDQLYDPYPPPAVGFDLLKGPTIQGNQNLPMTAAYYFLNQDLYLTDPTPGSYSEGAVRFYRFMQGLIGLTGEPFINPVTGLPTPYTLSGDPLTGEGWIDGEPYGPGDRRVGLASGPFQMAVGDTQEVVVAEIAAIGLDRLQAYRILKFYDALAQEAFDNGFNINSYLPPRSEVPTTVVKGTTWKINLNWGEDTSSVALIENFNQDGYAFQGYNVYQLAGPLPIKENAVRIATFDAVDGVTEIEGIVMDPVTGLPVNGIQQYGSDSGIERMILTNYDYIEDTYMKVGKKYYFAVTAYTYNTYPLASPNNTESLFEVIEAVFYDSLGGASYGDSINVTHSQGIGDGEIYVTVDDATQLTNDDYEVFFNQQSYYRNENGEWIPIGPKMKKDPGNSDDLTGSSLSAGAVYGEVGGTTEIKFVLDLVSPTFSYADGILLTFPPSIPIINALPCTTGQGPIVVPIINHTDNTVLYGNNNLTQNGYFYGSEELTVNVGTVATPITVDYVIYDDGYGPPIINAVGNVTIETIGYAFKTESHWNVLNHTTQDTVLEDQTVIMGYDLYTGEYVGDPIVEGFKISTDVSYDDPIGFADLELFSPSGLTILTSNSSTNTLDIQNYTIFGGTISSKAIDNFGVGTNNIEDLNDDYVLRFTGIYDSTIINGQKVYYVSSGGQMATVFRMISVAALANHPLNPNPGVAEPFLLRIPFEVWNVENPYSPYQVNLTFRDRARDGTENPFWAWNPTNRIYSIIVNSPYNPTQVIQVDNGPDPFNDPATWVLVHYGTNYHLDDVVTVIYKGPVQFGIDKFTFTTPEGVVSVEDESIPNKYQVFQNYPNPFNPSTIIRFTLTQQALVRLNVYNILGQRIAQLVNTELTAGMHEVLFDGSNLASGVYFYVLNVKDKFFEAKKMLLLK